MHRFLRFIRMLIIVVLSFIVTASCLVLILGLGNTEPWDGHTTQEKELLAPVESTAKPEAESQYKSSLQVSATAKATKPLSTWPPEEAEAQSR